MKIVKRIGTGLATALIASTGAITAVGATSGETTVTGFSFSESIIRNPATDRYLVSNTGNAPGAPAVPGFISSLKPNGQIAKYKWIDGANTNTPLNDPLGMTVYNNKLYVADVDYVRVFDANRGKHITDIHIPGVTGLNDITTVPGGVVVSDPGFDFATGTPTGTAAIYRVDGSTNQVTTLASGPQLNNPNGLLYEPGKGLLVAPTTSATILLVDITTGQVSNFATLPDVGYDGIAKVGNSFYFSNPPSGHIYKTDLNGNNAVLFATYPGFTTDINADTTRNRLLIPELAASTVVIKQL
jgi:hypothetical protein